MAGPGRGLGVVYACVWSLKGSEGSKATKPQSQPPAGTGPLLSHLVPGEHLPPQSSPRTSSPEA